MPSFNFLFLFAGAGGDDDDEEVVIVVVIDDDGDVEEMPCPLHPYYSLK